MPKGTRKSKSFYIDTNIALDYLTGRNRQTVLVLGKLKDKEWKCVSSSFLAMEMADYKNIDLYDFLKNSDDWQLAQSISFNSNLSAPDAIHLASAMLGSRASYCQVLITHDELLSKEGKRIIQDNKLSGIKTW